MDKLYTILIPSRGIENCVPFYNFISLPKDRTYYVVYLSLKGDKGSVYPFLGKRNKMEVK